MNRLVHIAALALSLIALVTLGAGCAAEAGDEPVEEDLGNLSTGRGQGNPADEDADDGAKDPRALRLELGGPLRDPCQGCGPGPQPWQARGLSIRQPN